MAAGTPVLNWVVWKTCVWAAPSLALAWLVALAGSFAVGGFVVAPAALAPKPQRLNPANNLPKLFSLGGLQGLLKSLIPSAFVLYITLTIMVRDWGQILQMCRVGVRSSLGWMLTRIFEISWKGSLVFTLWSGFDVLISRLNFERQLRMTRQEVREDFKETEGHPAIRGRIRRLQREMRRRRMLRDVARATVVVTNPNEYAVASRVQTGNHGRSGGGSQRPQPAGAKNQARSALARNPDGGKPASGSGALSRYGSRPGDSGEAVHGGGGNSGLHLPHSAAG